MRITGAAAVAGVAGRPIGGSLSPVLHNAWLAAAGLDGVYIPLDLADAAAFDSFVQGLRGGGSMRGLNVTAPFKERAIAAADRADPAAMAAGAANLLLFRPDGSVEARNTDGLGLLHALRTQAGFDPAGATVALLGAGGAARGAAATLIGVGAAQVRIVNRTPERARTLAEGLGGAAIGLGWDRMVDALAGAGLVVNATVLGGTATAPLDVALEGVAPGAVVMDMVYRPLRTALLAQAEAQGLRTADGLAMLIGQAIPSFEALFGLAPPSGADVRRAALDALGAGAA